MPIIAGFDKLASVAEEQITDKIGRRVISGKQGTMVYWRMKAGAHAAGHQHPQEQFVWVIKGAIRLRIGTEERAIMPGDIAVIPGGVEHEAFFPEDTDVIDFFAPVREDFLTGEVPSYMAQPLNQAEPVWAKPTFEPEGALMCSPGRAKLASRGSSRSASAAPIGAGEAATG